MTAFAFAADSLLPEVIRLADGRLVRREYNARRGIFGWLVYGHSGAREAFYSDREWARLRLT